MRLTVRLLLFCFPLLLFACKEGTERERRRNLPPARGDVGEVVLAIDSAQWEGPVGKELRAIFHEPIPGLPQPEQMFKLRRVDPLLLNDVLKQAKNLILVTTLDNNSSSNRKVRQGFTKASIEQIKKDKSLFMNTSKDQYARGQQVMFLFGQTEADLVKNLKGHREELRQFYNTVERDRMADRLKSARNVKGLSDDFEKKYGFSLVIPMGYELAQENDQFVWLRHVSGDYDKSILITWMDYTNESIFKKEQLIALRDSLTKKYVRGDDREGSYMKIERRVPVHTKEVNFHGHYAKEIRGLWHLNEGFMGGPFISYAIADADAGKFYFIDAFTYAPGNKKNKVIRELEANLWTFNIKDTSKSK